MPHRLPRFVCSVLLLALLAAGVRAFGQVRPGTVPSSRRCAWVRVPAGRDTTDFVLNDTLTVVPSSVAVDGRAVGYDARTGRYRIVWPSSRVASPEAGQADVRLATNRPDSVLVCYRVLPLRLSATVARRPRSLMDSVGFHARPDFGFGDFTQKEQILATPGINKTGNLTRGISFGNAQNVFVNSALNLQLEGKLTDNINLTANISDQNVPFQPEGNTQQLQEFDRIFITLTHPNWTLTAGDVVLRNKPDYFLRFYKNVQGAAVEVNTGVKLGLMSTAAGAAQPGVTLPNPYYPLAPTLGTPGVGTPPLSPEQGGSPSVNVTQPAAGGAGEQTVQTEVRGLRPLRSSTTVAAGVAKGKFASLVVPPIENVQGPYRLRGPNGEQFIIVLANSERVYLDGRLLLRGFDNDYVIDYNTAEVTFSPRHLITSNSRIRIDFEYSDFNYSRSLYHLSHYQEAGRLQLHANFYREADNPDNSPNLNLSDDDKELLRNTPANVSLVSVPGAPPVTYDRRQVQYLRRTDPITGQDIFVYATDSLSGQVYGARFTDVGQGNGDYVLSATYQSANGRVYEYRAPQNGVRQGRYRAERQLPTPLQKQLVTAGASYRLDPTASVFVDLAASQLDLNRFSPEQDQGRALRVGYVVQDRPLSQVLGSKLGNLPVVQGYKLRSALDYEYTSARFAPIDRYRDIEFDRNWSTGNSQLGVGNTRTPREDNILNFAVGAIKDADNNFGYRVSRRYRAGEVSGLQHWLDAAQKIGDVELRGSLFVLAADAGRKRSTWARGETAVRYTRGRIVPGYAYRFDKNRVQLPSGDSIQSANYFDEHAVFIQSQDTARTHYRLDYTYRRDQTPNAEQTQLRPRAQAQTVQGTLTTRLGPNQDLNLLATYRDLAARDSARQRTVLGQIGWNASLLNKQVRSELTYSVATGRELRRDYSYVPVPYGGTHYWRDAAPFDGQQQKDEFFEAQTPDAVYRTHIKVFIPTDDYIIAFTNRFGYRLTVAAPRGWREGTGWRAAVARLSTLSTVTLDRRTTDKSLSARLNPFAYQTDEATLLSLNKLLRNTVYFNRSNPIFGAEFTVQQAQQKSLLSTGTDTRNLASQSVLLRRNLSQSFTSRLTGTRSIRESQSTYLIPRNFRIEQYEWAPELSYQPGSVFRFTGTYLRTTKKNTLAGGAEADTRGTFDELGLETRISQVSQRTLSAATRFTRVAFQGDPASVVGLEILNALRPGNNLTWNLSVEQRLSNGLNLALNYDGRKANGLGVVHTGRMQVSVLF
ncbi:hypothetical protein F0P96_05275 [Hymenobacter busanensis]|uniref:Uncharacterized protein n=1 Tax=Hymenobacter busanensis TaxID=2607656 RepID=A0A7L5A1G6_9BACT|nr:hypothetical protein [Hymenobacter busanensis]KAA9338256.1 hypothetical protein F0P96_05275 [Hymenobacter busanensis]QHJ09321.1 hypothetical protein GUY19_19340 [Hymenobacter busanensis]